MNELKHSASLMNEGVQKLIFTILLLLLAGSSGDLLAQSDTGTITGRIISDDNQLEFSEYVMLLEETGDVAEINDNGEFIFEEVPEGNYTLVFRMEEQVFEEVSVTVRSGETEDVRIEFAGLPADEIEHERISTELSSRQIDRFGDYSVEEALSRKPGVQVSRDGRVNLRGAGFNSYYVTVNGQRMGTTGLGNRGADLGAISTDLIEELELIKILTPDMYADGLAGVVNLKTHSPSTGETRLSAGVGGGANTQYFNRAGATGRGWVRLSQPVSENASIAINMNFQQNKNAAEILGMRYGVTDFGEGDVDVLEQFSPAFQTDERERLGGSVNFDFEPTENTTFYLQGLINTDNREITRHRNSWLANENWEDQNTTGLQSSFNYDLRNEVIDIQQYTFQVGGRHLFDHTILEFNAGWAHAGIYKNDYRFPFQASAVEYTIDFENRDRPRVDPVDTGPEIDDMLLQEMTFTVDNHIDVKYSGNIDLEIPFGLGSFKLGSSALVTNKDANDKGAFSEYNYAYRGLLNLNGFEQDDAGAEKIFNDQYDLDWTVDTGEARSFFESSIPNMRLDEDLFYRQSEVWNYFANEQIIAGYGMTDLDFGSVRILAGARLEHTTSNYEGNKVSFNRFGQYEESSDTSVATSYSDIFPNAQIIFEPTEESSIHLAYSRSITRPDFNLIAPFELLTPEDTTIFKGNPGLQPITSDNFDLYLDHSFSDAGVISAGAYYKRLTNFIEEQEGSVSIVEGEHRYFDDFFNDEVSEISARELSFRNAEKTATVYGVEVGLQHHLSFLPGRWSNLGAFANYTWSNSVYESSRGEETAFPGQSPHVVNAALFYVQDRFSAQLSYHWTAEAINQLERNRNRAPSISSEQIYLDRKQEGYEDLSASLKFQVSEKFQIWTNVNNLLRNEQAQYAHSRPNYPTSIYKREGIQFRLGVQFDL